MVDPADKTVEADLAGRFAALRRVLARLLDEAEAIAARLRLERGLGLASLESIRIEHHQPSTSPPAPSRARGSGWC